MDLYADFSVRHVYGVTVQRAQTKLVVTFTTATASTGVVWVAQGRRTLTAMLPAYGSCPSAGTPADAGAADADAGRARDR